MANDIITVEWHSLTDTYIYSTMLSSVDSTMLSSVDSSCAFFSRLHFLLYSDNNVSKMQADSRQHISFCHQHIVLSAAYSLLAFYLHCGQSRVKKCYLLTIAQLLSTE